ncbi:uncharacterized protein NECHADRAFT_88859 [Fusarium vanettenii 77-13-4]|uniref:Uncharacterized protein n=1 Tax=Fusarium vanettenii (strain ATCC MYA-4622 / CBS 123669 / FGSC 9596 / NRRL 45880 / 77-13-4) TaxID=660122 RepID=C7ZN43_FUSV7|nr:uncharacterized protein NECHADRAFT_88859 [Fusarium vanettenii 77-13-4]EEU34569.1 predicted protein [Fusarium vanettenii 77-13-4]
MTSPHSRTVIFSPSHSSPDAPRLPLRVSSIRQSPRNPPGTTGARRPPPPTAPPGAGLVFAIIALVAIISTFLPGGHPGWVFTSSTNQTAEFNIWQPVHLLYRDYQDVLVPLLTPFELDGSVPLPRHLPSMMTAFHEELWEINLRLTSWKGSGLPGHGTALADRLNVCYTELLSIGDSITDFNREGRLLVGSSSPLLLAVALDQANSSQETAEKVRTELEPILDQIEKDLPASQDLWALDLLDAVQFTRQHYNEYILRIIPKLISRAIATLSTIDSTAAAQL